MVTEVVKQFFPINTATACQLKWTWSTVFLNDGTTASCHRVGRHAVALDDFDNFHNTPEKIQQRNTMLAGQWPQPFPYMSENEGCRYCQKIEAAGGQSDRMFHLQIPDLVPAELENDPNATIVTPRILEVFLSNTCNLSCTYCAPKNSSMIARENLKHGEFRKNGLHIPAVIIDRSRNRQYIAKFFQWLDAHSDQLRRLHLLGGEPLYQKEFFACLDFFEKKPNRNLELNIVTNLMMDPSKFSALVTRWKQMIRRRVFKRLDITVSIDCWGPEQAYARYGLDLDVLETNMQILLKERWIYLNINSTISPLTLRGFSDLVAKINQWKQQRKLHHHFQTVFLPAHHNPDIFGPDFWMADLQRAMDLMPARDWQEINAREYLQGITRQIASSDRRPELILQLQTHLDELDRRRGTCWKSLFPYLE